MKHFPRLMLGFIAFMIFFFFSGCKRDNEGNADLENLFEALAKPVEKASFNAEEGVDFFSKENYVIVNIRPGSLVHSNGSPVTGKVDMEFKALFSLGDMLRHNRPTQTIDGTPLESGGEFWLHITQNNEQLSINPNYSPYIYYNPAVLKGGMDVFYGGTNPETGEFGWVQDSTPDVPSVQAGVDITFEYYIYTDKLEWINCDRFMDLAADQKTTVCARFPSEFKEKKAILFLALKKRNCLLQLGNNANGESLCSVQIPKDEDGTLVALAIDGDVADENYHLAFQKLTLPSDQEIKLTNPKKTTLKDLGEFLDSL